MEWVDWSELKCTKRTEMDQVGRIATLMELDDDSTNTNICIRGEQNDLFNDYYEATEDEDTKKIFKVAKQSH